MRSIFKFIESLIPESLIARFTLIICIPMIACQFLAIYLFYERHWHNVTVQTSIMLSHEIGLIAESYNNGQINVAKHHASNFNYSIDPVLSAPIHQKIQKLETKILDDILKQKVTSYINLTFSKNNNFIFVFCKLKNGDFLRIKLPSKPLLNPTSEIYVFWITAISIIFIGIALLFSKNQIRSIEELSEAANSYGKNQQNYVDYKPRGALEIRQAGYALIRMRDRLEKQVQKRLQLLAMISHDLRTPLTRIILQLALMDKNKETELLAEDVESMKHMIDSYLDFARGEEAEKEMNVNALEWINEFYKRYNFNRTKLVVDKLNSNTSFCIKPLALTRALLNLVTNAEKYATCSELSISELNDNIEISIEDNGPGIGQEERAKVFKAFYRSDKARRIDQYGSVGLGLSIAKEIILAHKGTIQISDSKKLEGARIIVTLPISKYEK